MQKNCNNDIVNDLCDSELHTNADIEIIDYPNSVSVFVSKNEATWRARVSF